MFNRDHSLWLWLLLLDMCDGRTQEWNSELYDKNARFVSDLGTPLIASLLRPGPGERILDLGCGDGDLTAKIASLAPGVEVCFLFLFSFPLCVYRSKTKRTSRALE